VLAGDLGGEGLTPEMIIGFQGPRINPPIEVPTIKSTGADPTSGIKSGDKPLTFRTVGQQKDVALEPLNRIFDKRYIVYWQVS
jgi:uncharacterized protein